MKPLVRVWGDSSGLQAGELASGSDLVVHAPRVQADLLRHGVLLDDWLDAADRDAIDSEARAAASAWEQRNAEALTVAGVPLAHVHELELYADVFLRETRVLTGLERAATKGGAATLELRGFDPELLAALEARLEQAGIATVSRGAAAPPDYPIAFGRAGAGGNAGIRRLLAIPGRARGHVLVEPYPNLASVVALLGRHRRTLPVLNPVNLPALGGMANARALALGGWLGLPAPRALRRSRRLVAGAAPSAGDAHPVERLWNARCTRLLRARGGDSVALVDARRRAFDQGVRAVLAFSDAAPAPRLSAVAAREHGGTVVTVQHGHVSHLPTDRGSPARLLDGWLADVVAMWSEGLAGKFRGNVPGRVVVTGNPAAEDLRARSTSRHWPPRETLVLGQMPGPLTTAADVRITARHLTAALSALQAVPTTRVRIRPHPLDSGQAVYRRVAAGFPELPVHIDSSGPLADAIATADLCIGALSTATLEAAATGTPTALLDVSELKLEWPFDNSGAFPTARSAQELMDLLGILRRDPCLGRTAALEALGAKPGATQAITELVLDATS